MNQKALCPQHLWKELDVELGLAFRGLQPRHASSQPR